MIEAKLQWKEDENGYHFRLKVGKEECTKVPNWGHYSIHTANGIGSVGPLLGAFEDGLADLTEDQLTLFISHNRVAQFTDLAVRQIGLPSAAPFRLRIKGEGVLSQPGFRFQWQFIWPNGRPVMGINRIGTFLYKGSYQYLLLDPLYNLIEGMEAYNVLPSDDLDSRFLHWAELKQFLPEDAEVSDQLRTMHIVRADALSLDLKGLDDFDPILLTQKKDEEQDTETEDIRQTSEPILPEEPQRDFAHRFRSLPQAHQRYALSGNWYVVVSKPVTKALQVMREIQDSSSLERSAFIANPQGILQERLDEHLDAENIEAIFEEISQFVSARIQYLGVWQPKSRAFTIPSEQSWFPTEEIILGIPAGNHFYQIKAKDLPDLIEQIEHAQNEGHSTIEYNGQKIQTDEETLNAFRRVTPNIDREKSDDQEEKTNQSDIDQKKPKSLVAPIIEDNLDELSYQASPRPAKGQPGGLPAILGNVQLYPHQQEGLQWLQRHWVTGSPGALLADDMGLGKTLQTLAFMAWVQEQMEIQLHPPKPLLVVAPTGMLRNWESEANLHLKDIGLGFLFRAYGQDLNKIKDKTARERRNEFEKMGWVLTTYETLRDRYHYFLDIDWGMIVYDEAQKIKNPAVRSTDIAKSVGGDFGLALTGTPVENRLSELWCIIDTVHPGFLGAQKDFENKFEKPAIEDPKNAKAVKDLLETEFNSMPPKLLRRMKEDHLQGLPKKHDHVMEEIMPDLQAATYKSLIVKTQTEQNSKQKKQGKTLEVLQQVRKISLIPNQLQESGLTDDLVKESARLQKTIQILDKIYEKGEKALIFLEFLDIQAALLDYLQRRYSMPFPPQRISGQTSATQRKTNVDNFQASPQGSFQVMLLSPKAGGVGITLTAANHVIHLSRWWNPAVEDQCTDRALRIGQDKNVHVYYPLAIHPEFNENSFDKNLHELLTKKRELSRAVLAPVTLNKEDQSALLNSVVQDT